MNVLQEGGLWWDGVNVLQEGRAVVGWGECVTGR